MPTVSFEHIVKSYGSLTVLNDLNLAVEDGDLLTVRRMSRKNERFADWSPETITIRGDRPEVADGDGG